MPISPNNKNILNLYHTHQLHGNLFLFNPVIIGIPPPENSPKSHFPKAVFNDGEAAPNAVLYTPEMRVHAPLLEQSLGFWLIVKQSDCSSLGWYRYCTGKIKHVFFRFGTGIDFYVFGTGTMKIRKLNGTGTKNIEKWIQVLTCGTCIR